MNAELLSSNTESVLPTKGETSPGFYLMLIAGLLGLPAGLTNLMAPASRNWLGIATCIVGTAALGNCIRMASLKVVITGERLVFRRFWEKTEIAWHDVQSIRFKTMHGKYGTYGRLAVIEGPRHKFHFIVAMNAFPQLWQHVSAQCTRAVIMDDDTGTLHPPRAGDGDWRRSQSRKYAHRMVKARAFHDSGVCLAVILVGGRLLWHPPSRTSAGLVWAICLLIIALLVADVYWFAKRLWT